MYGKTLSIPDESLASWYSLLVGADAPADLGPRDAKRALARILVERFHGAAAAAAAEESFDRVHVRHELPEDMPDVDFQRGEQGTVHLPALIAQAFGVSNSEARRSLSQGGVRIDGEPLDADALDVPGDLVDGRVLQLGRRRFARVRLV
jgi:tyrosyl-tRNA synthetase